MSLCFAETRDARLNGAIELEEFLRHIVSHYGGSRHEADTKGQRPYMPLCFEREVRDILLDGDLQPLDDENTTIIYYIFLNAYQGDVAAVRKLTEAFSKGPEYYLRPLVRIAGGEGDSQLLRVCYENGHLAKGYPDPEYLLFSRVGNQPSTAWLDVLFEFDYRQWRTNPQQLSDERTWYHVLMMGADCARWWIEHGGRPARCRGLFKRSSNARRYPEAKTVRVLLDEFGIEWFKDSGALQLAVENHDFETVKMLVEAGADVNELPTDWLNDVREHRAAPLQALHVALFAKSEKMIRYLAEHGAKLTLKDLWIPDPYNVLPEEYKVFRDLIVELGAVKEETSS